VKMIAAVDRYWGIGLNNKLLVDIPSDKKFFRTHTKNKVVVLGRKTLETFPSGQPLKGRTNIILTTNPDYKVADAIIVHSLAELLEELKKYREEDIYIIGGETIYRQMLPYCDTAYITKIDHVYEADAKFPDLDADPDWEVAEESEEQTYFDLEYHFITYVRKKNFAQ